MSRKIAWIVLFLTIGGCAQAAHDVAKQAAPGGIEGAVNALNKPETQEAALQLAKSPILEETGRTIARGAADGIMQPLDASVTRAQLATDLTTDPMNYFGRSIGQGIVQQLRTEADHAGNSEAVRQITRQAVLGLHDGLKDLGVTDSPLIPSARKSGGWLSSMLTFVNMIIAGLALLVISLVAWIWVIMSRSRKSQAESRRKEAAARRLAEAIEVAERKPWGDELREVLRGELGRDFATDFGGSSRIRTETEASGKPTI